MGFLSIYMLDNSISVLSNFGKKIKKYLSIGEIIAQLIFISYYTYLVVVHYHEIVLFIAYTSLLVLGTFILFVKIFDFNPYDRKGHIIRAKWKRAIRIIAWIGRATVIGYNVYYLMNVGMTEVGKLFLIFSGLFLILEILLFIVSTVVGKYFDLFMYGLKVDYEHFNRGVDDLEKRPIAKLLNEINEDKDFEEEVCEIYIEEAVSNTVKRFIDNDDIAIEIKQRALEKKFKSYYNDSAYYYSNIEYLTTLLEDLNNKEIEEKDRPHFYVLKFFLINRINPIFVGLNRQLTRLVLSSLSMFRDDNELFVLDLTYLIILEQLINDDSWKKYITEKKVESKFFWEKGKVELNQNEIMMEEVEKIVKASIDEYEMFEEGTISSELKSMVKTHVLKTVGRTMKSTVRNIFKKK